MGRRRQPDPQQRLRQDLPVDADPARIGYLRFNVQGIGSRQVVSASLRLTVDIASPGNSVDAGVSGALGSWAEKTVTWTPFPPSTPRSRRRWRAGRSQPDGPVQRDGGGRGRGRRPRPRRRLDFDRRRPLPDARADHRQADAGSSPSPRERRHDQRPDHAVPYPQGRTATTRPARSGGRSRRVDSQHAPRRDSEAARAAAATRGMSASRAPPPAPSPGSRRPVPSLDGSAAPRSPPRPRPGRAR